VLAARLKRSHKNKYVRSARTLLGLKSSADITAYPAFYLFVQQHCPSVVNGQMNLEAWLQEPIFLADIGWAEWRRIARQHTSGCNAQSSAHQLQHIRQTASTPTWEGTRAMLCFVTSAAAAAFLSPCSCVVHHDVAAKRSC
jgi:hypothetical protein